MASCRVICTGGVPKVMSRGITPLWRDASYDWLQTTTAKVEEAADESFQPFLGLCAFAGLRLGEAAGIQVGDIDFLRRTLNISRQVQRGEIRAPNYGSERSLPARWVAGAVESASSSPHAN